MSNLHEDSEPEVQPMDVDDDKGFNDLAQDPLETMSDDEEDAENVTKNVTKDGGVTKKILKAGTGWEKPEKGDEVFVTYIGRLVPDGEVFDQNVNEENPFSFTLGKGMVIKGWDEGIAKMKKGERAILTIKPEYGYGETGAPPKIGPNATLEFEVQLLSWKSVNALTSDGKVTLKMTKKDESGWQTPKDGWEVILNCRGVLADSGTVFLEKKEFPFVVGRDEDASFPAGKLISKAIKKFKKGDQGSVSIPPEHGYGPEGYPTLGIPPSAALRYDLEVIRWHEIDRINGTPVVKKVLVEGTGWEKPKHGAIVNIRAVGRCVQSGKEILRVPQNEMSKAEDSHIVLGSSDLPEAVELALEQMKKGEKALITAPSEFGYGSALSKQLDVPPHDDFEFEVEVVSFEKAKETWEMDKDDKLTEMQKCREIGNKLFKDSKPRLAIKHYERAIKFFEHETNLDSETKTKINSTVFPCELNLAACHLKLQDWNKTVDHATKALKIEHTNVKALYRRAQAYLARQDYDLAKKDCEKALENADEGAKRDVASLLRQVRERIRQVEEKEKKLFSKMLSGVVGK